MSKMQKTQKNQKRVVQNMPPRVASKPTKNHPVVKLFDWMHERGFFAEFASYEDWKARRDLARSLKK